MDLPGAELDEEEALAVLRGLSRSDLTGTERLLTRCSVASDGSSGCRLLDMGLIPKTALRVEKIAPLGDPIELRVRGYALSLRKEDARNIEVEVRES